MTTNTRTRTKAKINPLKAFCRITINPAMASLLWTNSVYLASSVCSFIILFSSETVMSFPEEKTWSMAPSLASASIPEFCRTERIAFLSVSQIRNPFIPIMELPIKGSS